MIETDKLIKGFYYSGMAMTGFITYLTIAKVSLHFVKPLGKMFMPAEYFLLMIALVACCYLTYRYNYVFAKMPEKEWQTKDVIIEFAVMNILIALPMFYFMYSIGGRLAMENSGSIKRLEDLHFYNWIWHSLIAPYDIFAIKRTVAEMAKVKSYSRASTTSSPITPANSPTPPVRTPSISKLVALTNSFEPPKVKPNLEVVEEADESKEESTIKFDNIVLEPKQVEKLKQVATQIQIP